MTVTIFRAAPDDWQTLRDLRLTALSDAPYAFSSTYESMAVKPDDYWRDMARRRATGSEDCTFFARDTESGALVGMAGGYRDGDNRDLVHIVAVWVAPEARGAGVGDQLIEAVCAWASQIPVSVVAAYVSDGNHRARRFYERVGFAIAPPDTGQPGAHARLTDVLLLRSLRSLRPVTKTQKV